LFFYGGKEICSVLRINIAELPKEKAFGEFGFFVVKTHEWRRL
jgi:hypothetical protein